MDRESAQRVEDLDLCARCGGRCCKESPGRFAPTDFERSGDFDISRVENLLHEGRASIVIGLIKALNSPMAPIFMLKYRGKGKGELEFFCSDVECIGLTAQGCSFSLDERPFECAAIVPSPEGCCTLPGDLHMEDLWAPYQDALHVLITNRAGCEWFEEFNRQLADKRNRSSFKQEVQNLIQKYGLTTSTSEISLIADLARSL